MRREVTYDVFEKEIWPAIRGKRVHQTSSSTATDFDGSDPALLAANYHPSLIWTEINSFIKGSVEALQSTNGFLEREKYLELGKKRAPNFLGKKVSNFLNDVDVLIFHIFISCIF